MKSALFFGAILLSLLVSNMASAAPIKLNFWEQSPPETDLEIDKWITVFQRANPDIQIIRQHYETEELRTKFLRSSVTGDGADMVYGPSDNAGVFATAGVIQPISKLIHAEQFNARALELTRLDGKLWGVPLSEGNHLLLYYNKDRVKQAPTHTKDLIEQAQAFSNPKQNKYGLAFFQSEPFWFVAIQAGFGSTPLVVNGDQVRVTIDNPETTRALQFLVDLKNKSKIIPNECDYDCAKSMFLSGNALFHINGDWELSTFSHKFGDRLGVAALPIINETGKAMAPMLSGLFIYVNASTKGAKLEAVRKFLDFITAKQVQLRIASKLNKIPVNREALADPIVASNKLVSEAIAATASTQPMPPQVEVRAAWDGMRIMIQRALSGTETIEAAIKTGQKAANEALKGIQKTPSKS